MEIKKEEMTTPFTERTFAKLYGKCEKIRHTQAAAADATDVVWVAEFAGVIGDLFAIHQNVSGAGESMSYDVTKNGATIMKAPVVVTAAPAGTYTDLWPSIDPDKASFKVGDVFAVVRDYTAGGTPTPLTRTVVVIEPTLIAWRAY